MPICLMNTVSIFYLLKYEWLSVSFFNGVDCPSILISVLKCGPRLPDAAPGWSGADDSGDSCAIARRGD